MRNTEYGIERVLNFAKLKKLEYSALPESRLFQKFVEEDKTAIIHNNIKNKEKI